MKRITTIMLILISIIELNAQVPTYTFEKGQAFMRNPNFLISIKEIPEKKMPVFDVSAILAEDEATKDLNLPFRFGKSFDVNLTIEDGKWQKEDSVAIWSLKITSDNAYSLNFILSELYLPDGANLYIFNDDGSMVYGPVTEKQNDHGATFLTDIIKGASVIIRISVPLKKKDQIKLHIQNVIHGYKDIFNSGYGESGDCLDDNDIACFPSWNNESDGIVQILLAGGDELCSGALINNTSQDFKPYILTAFHCVDIGATNSYNEYPYCNVDLDEHDGQLEQYEINNAEQWLVRFRFKHTTCDGHTIASGYTYDDTHYRAGWYDSDFALVELVDDIYRDIYSVGQKVWLGWDRSNNTPTSGICIHHPSGDVMKLSSDNHNLTINSSQLSDGCSTSPANNFWVTQWDDGITEPGSSGAPLFNSDKRIVGQLSRSGTTCSNPSANSYFGRFNISWTGGGADTTRLSNWLQPTGTATTLNSIRQPTPQYSGGTDPLCSSASISATNLAPGYTIHQWNGSNVSFPNGNTSNPVNVSPGATNGPGWIEAVINTGAGIYTMPRKYFWVGSPDINNIVLSGEQYICPDGYNTITAYSNVNMGITDYTWAFPSGYSIGYGQGTNSISFYAPSSFSNYDQLILEITNSCGYSDDAFEFFEGSNCNYYSLSITPNPSNSETTITIETSNPNVILGETVEWDFEIYSETQQLKTKQTGLRGKSTKIQTAGWKEGVYVVRVKYKGQILTDKLMVKK